MARTFPSDRSWEFDFDTAELWERLTAVEEYPRWWPHVRRVLHAGGLLVADNAVSHAGEMGPFMALVKVDAGFATSIYAIYPAVIPSTGTCRLHATT